MRIALHETLEGEDLADWRAFLAAAERQHPRQDPVFAGVERAEGATPRFALGRRDGRVAAVALLSFRPHPLLPGRFAEAAALSGPVADDALALRVFLDGLACHPALRRTGRLRVSPYWTGPAAQEAADLLAALGFASAEAEPLRRTGWVPLEGDRETMMARFSKSARRELRRGERQGVEIAPVTEPSEAREVRESLNRLRTARGLTPLSAAGFEAGFEAVYRHGGTGIILAARKDGQLAGSLVLYRSAHVAHGRHFAPEPEVLRGLSNLRISPALWLAGMEWARAAGCRHLDVEGWRPDIPEDDPRRAIYKYKGELGPEEVARVAEHYRPLDLLLNAPGFAPARARRRIGQAWRRLRRHTGKG